MNKEWPSRDTEQQIEKWWIRAEVYLEGLGAIEFESLKEMVAELTVKTNQ